MAEMDGFEVAGTRTHGVDASSSPHTCNVRHGMKRVRGRKPVLPTAWDNLVVIWIVAL